MDDETLAALQLSLVPGLGPRSAQRLLLRFGGVSEIWRQTQATLADVPGIGHPLAQAIDKARDLTLAKREWERCRELGIDVVCARQDGFPILLHELPDPPLVLFVRGQLQPTDGMSVAMVGTRHASPYGVRQATRLAAGFASAGMAVVSGLARGIDAASHRAALAAGGRTIAVLAGGLGTVYPPEHRRLAEEITTAGALISEMPLDAKPRRGSFPRRNRLIAGLSLGVVVVEATQRSGALITARHALDQGRDVFAVPGPVDVRSSRGCHELLRDGAKLVETVDDVLEELGPLPDTLVGAGKGRVRLPGELRLNPLEQQVLEAIDSSDTTIDQLVSRCQLPIQRILATISVLETRHLIARITGGRVRRR